MRRASWLPVIMSGLVSIASSKFTFDGSSSDMVQQFYNLHSVGYAASALSLDNVPPDITTRLSNYSLEFANLPPLLQRAVLWDAGYVTTYGDDTKLSSIYTMCSSELTMADIALTLEQYEEPGCEARNCTDPSDNSTATHRSLYCTGAQMLSVSVCAASAAGEEMDASMWATGGNDALLPVPNAVTHKWTDSVTDEPYLVYAIHMVSPDHEWGSCPTEASKSAMVIPCVPYANVDTTSDWCRPSPGSLIDSWLSETPATGSASSTTATKTPMTSTGKSPLSATQSRTPPSLNSVLQSFANSAQAYDGTSSDLALQYLSRYAAGDVVDALKYSTSDLPTAIQDRLTQLGLKFEDLDGLLQRALIWDSGYTPSAADHSKLIKIYTKSGRSMADIVLPKDEYLTQCSVKTCTDKNGGSFGRSKQCNGDQMKPMVYCASDDVRDTYTHLSMWADGGIETDIPDPQIVRHYWNESDVDYLIFAIHTGPSANEPAWNECTTPGGYYGSMIVPCRPYFNISASDKSDWISPKTGALVAAWLEHTKDSNSWFKWWYVLLLALILLVALIVGVCCWRKKRQTDANAFSQDQQLALISPKDGATPLVMDYVETEHSGGSSMYHGLTTGSSTSTGERGSASDAIRFLQEDPALVRTRIPLEELQFTRILAKGGFGEVWMGYNRQTPVAIKKLLSSKQQFESVQGFIEEIKLTSSLDHPNIIHFVGVAWSKLENLCMVIEYLETGDLQTFLERNNKTLTWNKEKYPIALGAVSAISYLHARRPAPLIHRDIKAKNILLTPQLQPKLIDFGVSRDRVQETMTAGIGTPYWAAPEVLEGNRYTEQSDIYSFGILLSEIDTAETPFSNVRSTIGDRLSAFQILNLVLAGKLEPELSSHCPPAIAVIMQDCLRLDPMRRPTASQLVERFQSILVSSRTIQLSPPPPYPFQGNQMYSKSYNQDTTF